jgi:hypothetical protein
LKIKGIRRRGRRAIKKVRPKKWKYPKVLAPKPLILLEITSVRLKRVEKIAY